MIGILLFLLFNNKNKFSIGVPDDNDSSQSDEDDIIQTAGSVQQVVDSDVITADDGIGVMPGILSLGVLDPEIFIPSCAAAVGLLCAGDVAYRAYSNYNNPRQQILDSDPDVEIGVASP